MAEPQTERWGEMLLWFSGGGRGGGGGLLGTAGGAGAGAGAGARASDVSSPMLPQGSEGEEGRGSCASSRASPRARLCPDLHRQPAWGSTLLAEASGWERGVK